MSHFVIERGCLIASHLQVSIDMAQYITRIIARHITVTLSALLSLRRAFELKMQFKLAKISSLPTPKFLTERQQEQTRNSASEAWRIEEFLGKHRRVFIRKNSHRLGLEIFQCRRFCQLAECSRRLALEKEPIIKQFCSSFVSRFAKTTCQVFGLISCKDWNEPDGMSRWNVTMA